MSEINHEQLGNFQKRLKQASRAKPPVYSVEDVVTKSFGLIDQARKTNVPWEDITQMFNESIEKELSVRTVKFYYFKVQKALREGTAQPQSKHRPKAQGSTRKPSTQSKVPAAIDEAEPSQSLSSAQEPTPKQSQVENHFTEFDAAQSENQPTSLSSDASVEEWVESEFNVNRVRPQSRPIAV